MATPSTHLIERAAERLRAASGLIDAADARSEQDRHLPDHPLPDRSRVDGNLGPEGLTETGAGRLPLRQTPMSDAPDLGSANSGIAITSRSDPGTGSAELRSAPRSPDSSPPQSGLGPLSSTAKPASGGALPVLPNGPVAARPVAPRIVDLATLERSGLVVGRKSRTRISEEFRIAVGHVLRTLQTSYTSGHGAANLVLVTSSRPGEGKSFTALNLAGCIAQQDNREVLLIDTDAKQRPITYDLGLGDAPGLLDLVRTPGMRIDDVIVPTAIPSLSVVPIGDRLSGNAELSLSRPVTAVIERLARRFANRVIILDAPPCLSASDPSALAPLVGQTVMVVEAERTQRNELEAALEMIRVCPTITLLLNKIQLTTSYTFGAYHYFGTYS